MATKTTKQASPSTAPARRDPRGRVPENGDPTGPARAALQAAHDKAVYAIADGGTHSLAARCARAVRAGVARERFEAIAASIRKAVEDYEAAVERAFEAPTGKQMPERRLEV